MDQLSPFIVYLQLTTVMIDLEWVRYPTKIHIGISTADRKSTFAVQYRPFWKKYSKSRRYPIKASLDIPITELHNQFFVHLQIIDWYRNTKQRAEFPSNIIGSWPIDVPGKTGVVVSQVTGKFMIGKDEPVNLALEYKIERRDGNCTDYSPSTTVTSRNKFRPTSGMTESSNRNESNFTLPSIIVIVILVVILMFTIVCFTKQIHKIRPTATNAKKKERKPNEPKMIPYNQRIGQYAATQYRDALTMENSKSIFRSKIGMPYSKQYSAMRTNGKQSMWNLKKVGQRKATHNNDMKTMSSLTKKD